MTSDINCYRSFPISKASASRPAVLVKCEEWLSQSGLRSLLVGVECIFEWHLIKKWEVCGSQISLVFSALELDQIDQIDQIGP